MNERRPPRVIERPGPTPAEAVARKPFAEPGPLDEPGLPRARAPRAISVDRVRIEDDAFAPPVAAVPAPPRRRGVPWLAVAGSALLGLIGLALGLWVETLVGELFALSPLAGAVGLALVALLVLGLTVAGAREIAALRRLGTWCEIRALAASASAERDPKAAARVEADLLALFRDRPDLAGGRRTVRDAKDDVLDPADRVLLAERALIDPLDRRARALVLRSARRVSVVTAVAPRALIDVAFVILESSRLIRAVAELYGMRPGRLGFLKLCRDVIGHLAVTGAIAVGDSIVGEALGHGVASKVSRRFGEGVLNGLMTVRVGISAMDLCRPLPFREGERPTVGQFARRVAEREEAPPA